MRAAPFALAVLCGAVQAQNIVTGAPSPTTLHVGAGTGKAVATLPDFAACLKEAEKRKPGKYVCKSTAPIVVSLPAPPVELVKVWVQLASEGARFTLKETTAVRYGADTRFFHKILPAGEHLCGQNTFDGDPAYGTVKICETQVEVPAMPPVVDHSGHGPVINPALMPPRGEAYTTARVRSTWRDPKTNAECAPFAAGCVVSDQEKINPSDIGAFREPCGFSHINNDDPIVYPGQPGKAHSHTYFGNASTDAFSTQKSLSENRASTCAGGTLNATALWIPTLIDTSVGRPLVPGGMLVYYKGNYQFDISKLVEPYPAGLRMIAGDAKNTDPAKTTATWICYGPNGENPGSSATIAAAILKGTCKPGGELGLSVPFPLCWDGINLDSPNHASHMAYPVFFEKENRHGCPATHPRVLPNMQINVGWKIKAGDDVSKWRISSDPNGAPAGVSAHADYWFNWDAEINRTWTRECLTTPRDGHAFLLCDGRTLY